MLSLEVHRFLLQRSTFINGSTSTELHKITATMAATLCEMWTGREGV
jgi:hypothetical protein